MGIGNKRKKIFCLLLNFLLESFLRMKPVCFSKQKKTPAISNLYLNLMSISVQREGHHATIPKVSIVMEKHLST